MNTDKYQGGGFSPARKKADGKKRWAIVVVLSLIVALLAMASPVYAASPPATPPVPDVTVSTETDLKAAIASAPTGSQYVIAVSGTIELTAMLTIPAGKDIALTGGGILSASGTFNTISVTGSLTLWDITVTHDSGVAGRGIAVNSGGSLDMESGSAVLNNSVSGQGGGVYVYANATFTMDDGTISGNTATVGASYTAGGGGVFNAGTFILNGGEISGNTSMPSGSYIYVCGGGVGNTRNATFTMNGGAVTGNTATGNYGNGGGVGNAGGSFTLNDGAISGNTVSQNGGGVINTSDASYTAAFTMNGGVVSDNTAIFGGGVYSGELYNPNLSSLATFTMNSGEISGNTASNNGGGVYLYHGTTVLSGKISGNKVSMYGGGIYNYSGSCTITSSSLSDSCTISANTANGFGGGIYNYSGPVTIDSCTFSGNSATLAGGGIYQNGGQLSMDGGTVSGNSTTYAGGGNGGGICLSSGQMSLSGVVVSGNTSTGNGGGVYLNELCTMTMDEVSVSGNTVSGDGGGIFTNGTVTIQNGVISDNTATGNGGGVYILKGTNGMYGTVSMSGTVSDNTAGMDGGGVCTADTSSYGNTHISVIDGQTIAFKGNTARYAVKPGSGDWVWTSQNLIDSSATSLSTGLGTAFTNYDINYAAGAICYNIEVTDDGNGSASANAAIAVRGDKVTLAATPDSGYDFDYWEVAAAVEGDTVTLSDVNDPDAAFTMPASDVSLTAHFKAQPVAPPVVATYTVTYDGNGFVSGSAPVDTQSPYDSGSSVTVLGQGSLARPGYSFLGWSAEKTATTADTAYAIGGTFNITGDTTLYAVWKQDAVIPPIVTTYTVTYDGNGALSGSAPVDTHSPYDSGSSVTVLGQGSLARPGYSFLGWSSEKTATTADTAYAIGGSFKITANTTLYAVWKQDAATPPTPAATYTVTYAPGAHGTFATKTTSGLSYGAATPAAPIPTNQSGWRFNGWSPTWNSEVTGNVTYTATWKQASAPAPTPTPTPTPTPQPVTTYTVTYNPGAHGAFASVSVSGLHYGAATPAAPQTPGQSGWAFSSWSPSRGSTVTGSVVYTALWKEAQAAPEQPATTTVTVKFVDWNGAILKTQQVAFGGDATPPAVPARAGYDFTGWSPSYTNVQADITVTAQYDQATAPATTIPVQPTDPTGGNGSSGAATGAGGASAGGASNIATGAGGASAGGASNIATGAGAGSGGLMSNIGANLLPLSLSRVNDWALANLIFAVVGIILALGMMVEALGRKRNDEEALAAQAGKDTEKQRKRRNALRVAAVILGVFGLALFLLTEDMTQAMAFADSWTLIGAIILIAEAVCVIIASRRVKQGRKPGAGARALEAATL